MVPPPTVRACYRLFLFILLPAAYTPPFLFSPNVGRMRRLCDHRSDTALDATAEYGRHNHPMLDRYLPVNFAHCPMLAMLSCDQKSTVHKRPHKITDARANAAHVQ